MFRLFRQNILSVAGVILVCAVLTAAVPPDPVFVQAKNQFLKEMKRADPAARVRAVVEFSHAPFTGTAELLLKRVALDHDISVHQATRLALRQLAGEPAIWRYLMDELKRSFRKTTANEMTVELLRPLVLTVDEDCQTELIESLDQYLAAPKASLLVPISVIDDFASEGSDEAVTGLRLLSKAQA